MRVKQISTTFIAFSLATCALMSQAKDNNTDHTWMPNKSSQGYWQKPDWSGISNSAAFKSGQPAYNRAPAPLVFHEKYQPPAAPGKTNPASDAESDFPPPPTGPYRSTPYKPDNDNAASKRGKSVSKPSNDRSAYYTPRYNTPTYKPPYRNKRRENKQFRGRSGPDTWMNPNRGNMGRGWDGRNVAR